MWAQALRVASLRKGALIPQGALEHHQQEQS
jgi:hypothetical protein